MIVNGRQDYWDAQRFHVKSLYLLVQQVGQLNQCISSYRSSHEWAAHVPLSRLFERAGVDGRQSLYRDHLAYCNR